MVLNGVTLFRFPLRTMFLMVLAVALVGCGRSGNGSVESVVLEKSGDVLEGKSGSLYLLPPTATPWPTFTPMPTVPAAAVATLVPTMVPTVTPELPRVIEVVLGEDGGGVDLGNGAEEIVAPVSVTVVPSPTPYGKIWSADVFFKCQSLFVSQVGAVPDSLKGDDLTCGDLPAIQEVFSRTSPFLNWAVIFDLSDAPADFVMRGEIRWWDLNHPTQDVLMIHGNVEIVAHGLGFYFYEGMGRSGGGFWRPGKYRVELVDDRFERVVSWDFLVK